MERLLGEEGCSAVYLVSERHNKQNVFALKEVINPSGHDRKRLLSECALLERLNHRALPGVYHVFEQQKLNRVYLLMENIEGKNLKALRQEQPGQRFPLRLALAIMAPIADALIYLQQQEPPIVHRDIKPANIIVPMDGGEAVLVDFGTAKEYLPEGTTNVFRQGSPGYAAIEQYSAGSGTDLRTDVYGLGATFYTLLTGVTPLDAVVRITAEKGRDPLEPVSALVPTLPKPVSDAIGCALSIYQQDRFPTAEVFWHALHADSMEQQEQDPILRLPDTPLPPIFDQDEESTETAHSPNKQQNILFRKSGRVLALFLALLLSLVLGLGLLGFLLYVAHPAPPGSSAVATSVPPSVLTSTPKPATSPTPTLLYPPIAASYAGTISDIAVANTSTKLYLTQVRQDQNRIAGYFQGLGLVGPFTGTVTASGKVHFTVKIDAGVMICDGQIKVGGDIEGTFNVVDQLGRSLGEYGPWYVSATS